MQGAKVESQIPLVEALPNEQKNRYHSNKLTQLGIRDRQFLLNKLKIAKTG